MFKKVSADTASPGYKGGVSLVRHGVTVHSTVQVCMSNHGFGPTAVVCVLISLYHRKSWFSGAAFIGYGQQYRG